MKSIKLLVFLKESDLKPIGGPAGYVFNLFQGLKKISDTNVHVSFLPESNGFRKKKVLSKFYDSFPLSLKKIYRIYGRYVGFKNIKRCVPDINAEIIDEYEFIHFHSCFSLYKNKNVLKKYKGKIILTTHCPKPPQLEKIEDQYSKFERIIFGKKHLFEYEKFVRYAFDRADFIIFPCPEAEEPYFNNWKDYEYIHNSCRHKLNYIISGLEDCNNKCANSKEVIRDMYNIPQDAFVVSFVGRHNIVKGYDSLRRIASSLKNKKVFFLIAGEEAPLTRPHIQNWIEVGWTKDPYSLIRSSDLFVLPNKETYFDLVLLEVLSLGKAVLATNTGGNKFFSKYNTGITLYDNEDEAVSIIEDMVNDPKEVSRRGILNSQIFKEYFSDSTFALNYVKLINNLSTRNMNN